MHHPLGTRQGRSSERQGSVKTAGPAVVRPCDEYVNDVIYLLITVVAFALLTVLVSLLDRGDRQ